MPVWAKPGSSSAIKASPEYQRPGCGDAGRGKSRPARGFRHRPPHQPRPRAARSWRSTIPSRKSAATRRPDVPDRNLPQRHPARKSLRRRDRRAPERSPHGRTAGRAASGQWISTRISDRLQGLEERKGAPAGAARGADAAGPPACAPRAISIWPTASRMPASTTDRLRRSARSTGSTSASARSTSKDIDLVDRCESCHLGTREPVTLTRRGHGRRSGFRQPSQPGTAEDPRSREVRLHALPRRQWRGVDQRGEGARLQRTLAVAAAPPRKISRPAASNATRRKSSPKWPPR